MNVLSLFTGIGGLDLGLERAGMTTVGQVEIDPFCRSVLDRHWPEVPRHDDVRTAPAWWAGDARPRVDVVAGGFPCQPFSVLGRKHGVADERWGWPWMLDVVRAVRPRFVVVENVSGLLRDRDAFGWLLGDLADHGFDAEWSLLRACALGAPHVRERLFVVAYPDGFDGTARMAGGQGWPLLPGDRGASSWPDRGGLVEADARGRRMAHGATGGLDAPDRVKACGNAVVPAVAELVGRRVMSLAGEVAR